ncbi:cytochrome P450 [Peniophora sp. CONT]|nr:cytochrome P450 [Peniophora sp. CONT]
MAFFDAPASQLYCLAAAAIFCVVVTVRYLRRPLLKDIRGPSRSSFWLGNITDYKYQNEVGDIEFQWLKEYGGAWKIHDPVGGERLMLADPKGLQYVLQTSGYRFPKSASSRGEIRMIFGNGILWVHGEQHNRQRKIMNPAFSVPQLKSFLPLFLGYAEKLVQKWKEEEITPGNGAVEPVIDVYSWLSRTTLDVIGEAGFGFQFGALDNKRSELSAAYEGLFLEGNLYPARWLLIFRTFWHYIHPDILFLMRYLPNRESRRFRHYLDYMRKFGRELISQAKVDNEAAGKDVMSVLLRANGAEDAKLKLDDREVVDQISNLVLAGHDTTSSTLTFWLWELARHPEWQSRVRDEIRAVRRKLADRGDGGFSLADLEGMSAMQATLKEAMRLHPIVPAIERKAGQDDVIPLANPIVTKSGQTISSIPVQKGQEIQICIASYNRNPEVWGADADEWNPDRFAHLDKANMTSVGLYANLLTFSAGLRGCIGWRFAVIEAQAIAATLIESFEFALPPQTKENIVHRKPTVIMAPTTESHPGGWLGLKVKYCGEA